MRRKQYLAWMMAVALSTGICCAVSAADTDGSSGTETGIAAKESALAAVGEGTEAMAADRTEPEEPASEEASEVQTGAPSGADAAAEEIPTESDTDISAVEEETPGVLPDQEPETEQEAQGQETVLDNSDAFDLIIIEDENGIMEQVDSATQETGAEVIETEAEPVSGTVDPAGQVEIKLEKETVTRWGESLIDFQSYPVGDISVNEAEVYRFLREDLGLNKAAACGVLANIYCESAFSTVAVGDGGTSYGLCQWHAERFTSLVNWCGARGYNYHLLEGQLQYMKAELESGYSGVLAYLKSVPDTARGAYQAGYYWCMHYEMPGDMINRSIQRGKIAMNNYFPADLDHMEGSSGLLSRRRKELMDTMMLIEDPEENIRSVADLCIRIDLPDSVLGGNGTDALSQYNEG